MQVFYKDLICINRKIQHQWNLDLLWGLNERDSAFRSSFWVISGCWRSICWLISHSPVPIRNELRNTENNSMWQEGKKKKLCFLHFCVHLLLKESIHFLKCSETINHILKNKVTAYILPAFWHLGKFTHSKICLSWVFQILIGKQECDEKLVLFFFYLCIS